MVEILIKTNAIEKMKNLLINKVKTIFSNFKDEINKKVEEFKIWLSELPGLIGYYIGALSGDIYQFFTKTIPELITSFSNWIQQQWGDFKNWLANLPSEIWKGLCNIGNEIKTFFTKTIPETWNNFVNWIKEFPSKFLEFGKNIIQGLTDGIKISWGIFWKAVTDFIDGFVQGFKDSLGIHSPSTVFTKFGEYIIQGLIQGIQNTIDSIKNKIIEVAVNIKEWFSKEIINVTEKGKEIIDKIISGIDNSKQNLKENIISISGSIISWFSTNTNNWWETIKSWFSIEKWKGLAQNAVTEIQKIFNNFNFKIKMPHFTWTSTPATGWISNVLSALNLPTSLPKLNVSWYASGGMPDVGEMFIARESGPEMVGKIGNRTTVANNDQIVTAIEQGVYRAVSNAMANGSNEVHLDIRTDEGIIVKKASQGFKDYVMQTGELPFPVPV